MPTKTNWTRLSELSHLDAIGTDVVMRVVKEIKFYVNDPKMFDSIPRKVARAVVERSISPRRLGEVCDAVVAKRMDGSLRSSPGRYFTVAMKNEFKAAGVPWDARGLSGEES